MSFYTIFLATICHFQLTSTHTFVDYENVVWELFNSRQYNNKVLPQLNSTEPVYLDISLHFSGIDEINEVKETVISTGYLDISWYDERLAWESHDYGYLPRIFVPQDDLWKPDLVLVKGFKKFKGFGGSFYYIQVDKDGLAHWLPFEVFESRCKLDTKYYPFDQQKCSLVFSVWSHTVDEVKIESSSNGIKFDDSFQGSNVWTILSTNYAINEDETGSNYITFTFIIKRRPLYYIMNIIIPIVFLGFLNGFAFLIPAESGEKMGYSVTVFLSIVVFLTIIGSLLPVTSVKASILGFYVILQVAMGTMILVISTVQMRLNYRGPHIPVEGVFLRIAQIQGRYKLRRKITAKVCDRSIGEELPESKEDYKAPTWDNVVTSIDYVCFWSFSTIYTLLTIVTFSILKLQLI